MVSNSLELLQWVTCNPSLLTTLAKADQRHDIVMLHCCMWVWQQVVSSPDTKFFVCALQLHQKSRVWTHSLVKLGCNCIGMLLYQVDCSGKVKLHYASSQIATLQIFWHQSTLVADNGVIFWDQLSWNRLSWDQFSRDQLIHTIIANHKLPLITCC